MSARSSSLAASKGARSAEPWAPRCVNVIPATSYRLKRKADPDGRDSGGPARLIARVVCAEVVHRAQPVTEDLELSTAMDIEIRIDPARMLPVDVPVIQGDAALLQQVTGWQPTIVFEQTLLDVLDDCRKRVKAAN